MIFKRLLAVVPLLLLAPVASAALYITDNITVGIYTAPDMKDEEARLTSGTVVEVVERRGPLVKVRTEHGDQGWLKEVYLLKREPAAMQLEALRKEQAQLEHDLEALQEENATLKRSAAEAKGTVALRGELERLRQQNESLTAQLALQPKAAVPSSVDDQVAALRAQVDALQGEKGNLEQRLAAAVLIEGGTAADFEGTHEPGLLDVEARLPGIILVLLLGVLLGAGLSYRWIDRRLMKRFGGIRFH